MRGRAAMTPRGHRGHQGAADGAPDRAALAADQGARCAFAVMFVVLLLLRQADLQRAGLAVRVGGRPGELQVHLHRRCWNISSPSSSSRCSARPSCRSRSWRRRSTCSSRPASIATSARRSCRISSPRRSSSRSARRGLFPGHADAGALLARHAAAGRRGQADDRAAAQGRRISLADDEARSSPSASRSSFR